MPNDARLEAGPTDGWSDEELPLGQVFAGFAGEGVDELACVAVGTVTADVALGSVVADCA